MLRSGRTLAGNNEDQGTKLSQFGSKSVHVRTGHVSKLPILHSIQLNKKQYTNGSLLYCCAGLGDNETVVTIEKAKGSFRLNIGNNDISPNTTGWIEKIKAIGIKVEEAETTPELQKYARDCSCGIVYGF